MSARSKTPGSTPRLSAALLPHRLEPFPTVPLALRLLKALLGALLLASAPAAAYDHVERGDAGDQDSAQLTYDYSQVGTSLTLGAIEGRLGPADFVDAYCIHIDDVLSFQATTNPLVDPQASADFDTRLFLFEYDTRNTDPVKRLANDDSPFPGFGSLITDPATYPGVLVNAPIPLAQKRYLLAINAYPNELRDTNGDPNFDFAADFKALHGPAIQGPATWDTVPNGGSYRIALTGASGCGPNLAFVTEQSGSGDLSTWADAGGLSGLEAADAVCAAEANAAGLSGRFRAMLSNSTDDAFCRVMDYSGQVSNNCGLGGTVSDDLVSWVRPDGSPFIRDFRAAVYGGQIFYPVGIDLGGQPATEYFTGSDQEGRVINSQTCADWTGVGSSAELGRAYGGGYAWLSGSFASCAGDAALLCLQVGFGPQAPAPEPVDSRQAFLTSTLGNGDLSSWPEAGGQIGLAAGDTVCQQLAAAAGLSFADSYVAYLSTETVDVRNRLPSDSFPWTRLDGTILGTWSDLTTPGIGASLSQTELGTYSSPFIGTVATGTDPTGVGAVGLTCADWSTTTGDVVFGVETFADSQWSTAAAQSCFDFRHLYCFATHQVDLFSDGFESGDTLAWN